MVEDIVEDMVDDMIEDMVDDMMEDMVDDMVEDMVDDMVDDILTYFNLLQLMITSSFKRKMSSIMDGLQQREEDLW